MSDSYYDNAQMLAAIYATERRRGAIPNTESQVKARRQNVPGNRRRP